MLCEEKKTKIYTAEGEFLVSVNNKEQPELDEEYYINNTYVGTIQFIQYSLTKKCHSNPSSAVKFSCKAKFLLQYSNQSKKRISQNSH
jgi:hypothetical protein